MKEQAEENYGLSRYGAHGRARPKIVERGYRCRVDQYLRQVGETLGRKDPEIVASQPPSGRFPETDVKPEVLVIDRQGLIPAILGAHPFSPQQRPVETDFHQAHAGSPDIEIAIAARFDAQEYEEEQAT